MYSVRVSPRDCPWIDTKPYKALQVSESYDKRFVTVQIDSMRSVQYDRNEWYIEYKRSV